MVLGGIANQSTVLAALLLGGTMVAQASITAEQLTTFVFYVQLVTSASLAVADQVTKRSPALVAPAWFRLRMLVMRDDLAGSPQSHSVGMFSPQR